MPAATRARAQRWRDPRLWVGVALVAVSVVVGARIAGAETDSVRVWAAARDLPAGHLVDAEDLVVSRVTFETDGAQEHYLAVDAPLPGGRQLAHPLAAGDLVAASSLGTSETEGLRQVSLAVDSTQLPTGVAAGSVVDVWVVGEGEQGRVSAQEVLTDVVVVAAPRPRESFGSVVGRRQLVLGVEEDQTDALAGVLAATLDDGVRIVAGG